MIRVMLVDDQKDVRDGLSLMLSHDPSVRVVACCANGAEALEALRALDAAAGALPNVALMDVRMPIMDGIDATRRIHRVWPDVGVLILTTYDQDDYALGALAVGASGFLLKDAPARAIVDAVHAVCAGDAVLTPRVTKEVITRAIPEAAGSRGADMFSRLPPRELEVASLVAEGLSNAEIAARMSIEPTSVKRSVSRIISKLGLGSRVQVAVAWWRSGRR
jgi:DNA-binding NarL/FixJ family response regulator